MLKTLLTHGFFRPGRFSSRDCWGDDYLTQGKNKVLAPILPVPLNWAQWELGKSCTDCIGCTRGSRGREGGEEGEREEEKRGGGRAKPA